MKFFTYDRGLGGLVLNDEGILLVKEFNALMDLSRNKSKTDKTGRSRERAFREFQYIYLFMDWESPYANFLELARHEAALSDSELTQEEFDDETFRAACRKYQELQESNITMRLYKGAINATESVIYYLEHVDVNEKGEDGKPLIKTKDLMAELKTSRDLITVLKDLEKQVKQELESKHSLRGNVEAGAFD